MGYWKSKVAPKIKKIFDKDGKKAAAADFCKSFNKDEISKEVEEKKSELQPKVVVVYEAASAEIKTLVKEGKQSGVKKHSLAVTKFLQELITIEFPGAKKVSEAAAASARLSSQARCSSSSRRSRALWSRRSRRRWPKRPSRPRRRPRERWRRWWWGRRRWRSRRPRPSQLNRHLNRPLNPLNRPRRLHALTSQRGCMHGLGLSQLNPIYYI
uniref:Plasma membrane-associated cation-binding protein 1 n=1 Tax=Ananas comosus var. bracteatus TaxID=296719 RepID=A0A6V7QKP4_ANACO|nr:unnamed protein product [Ananas comosus var. bracteatus]